jgi:hypothetical protein
MSVLADQATLLRHVGARPRRAWPYALALGLLLITLGGRAGVAAPADDLLASLAPAPGDRVTIETARAADGRRKVSLRGERLDGRRLLAAIFAALSADDPAAAPFDLDLDVTVARLVGHNGEALRAVSLKLSAQSGEIRTFELAAKLGDGVDLLGELRTNGRGERLLYLQARDAGAFFRFTGIYRRMQSGEMTAALVVPTADRAPREGVLTVRGFRLVGEAAVLPLAPPAGRHRPAARKPLAFARLRIGFTSSPGRVTVDEGILVGTSFGTTARGTIDLAHDAIALRGVAIPLWAADPRRGIIPQLWLLQWGVLGKTYTLAGPLRAPVLKLDPVDAVAPEEFRRLFEFGAPVDRSP